MKSADLARQVTNLVVIPLGIAINVLPVTPLPVGVVARQHEPLLAAAGWAFAIWGVIFAMQLAYAIFQALPSQRCNRTLRRIGWMTALNAAQGAFWTLAFTHEYFGVAWLLIVANLISLLTIELRLGADATTGRALVLIRLPFAINFGWITCATLLDTAQTLKASLGWEGGPLTAVGWSVALVLVAAAVGAVMLVRRHNIPFGAVVVWGLVAIATYRAHVPALMAVSTVCAAGIAALVAVTWAHANPMHLHARPHPLKLKGR
jgi:hypothetical protein